MQEDVKPNLEGIKAGDWIWVEYMRFGVKLRRYERVSRLTRTLILAGGSRYYLQGGCELAGGSMNRCMGIASEEERAAFDRDQAIAAEREERLGKEEKALRRKFGKRKEFALDRRGTSYEVHFYRLTHAQAVKLAEALKR